MMEVIYRYRPIGALLDQFSELENQEIFFSDIDSLNDPMEGFSEFFWSGDKIVWDNLVKHYILCLYEMAHIAAIAGDEFNKRDLDSVVFKIYDDLPQASVRSSFCKIYDKITSYSGVGNLIERITKGDRRIYEIEMAFYLKFINAIASSEILIFMSERGLFGDDAHFHKDPAREDLIGFSQAANQSLSDLSMIEVPFDIAEDEFQRVSAEISESLASQMMLLTEYNNGPAKSGILKYLCIEFPYDYLKAVKGIVFPPWFVSCFSGTAINASMWGVYGGGHRGACLIFQPDSIAPDHQVINLNMITGYGGRRDEAHVFYGNVQAKLERVEYEGEYLEIDFFKSIGRISFGNLMKGWYRDKDGNLSVCALGVVQDEAGWRERYWGFVKRRCLTKLKDWHHEDEYRIIIDSSFNNYSTSVSRKIKYDFKNLKGIIFGLKTEMSDKIKILRILNKKLAENKRSDFQLFQCRYSSKKKAIEIVHLDLINWSEEK